VIASRKLELQELEQKQQQLQLEAVKAEDPGLKDVLTQQAAGTGLLAQGLREEINGKPCRIIAWACWVLPLLMLL
jgi:hypothetical protein